jgi:CheY-like chemotaxis protein
MTGTDIIMKTVQSMQEIMEESDDSVQEEEELFSSITTIKSCLQDIINTNQFMLMSINRCIDYTKSTDGLKLKPKYDTIDIVDTLRLPIICMRNTQESCVIYMNPLPPDLCSHVITDKQWLQENLLCLLSNAVKYSSGGEVSVTVSLHADGNVASTLDPVVVAATADSSLEPNTSRMHCTGTLLRIEVQDCGIGVPESLRECLFHPFKQTQKLAGGTGLGLYSLAKRMEALGGGYGVEGRRDGLSGSIFHFAIPYRPDWVSHDNICMDAEVDVLTGSDALVMDRPTVSLTKTSSDQQQVTLQRFGLEIPRLDIHKSNPNMVHLYDNRERNSASSDGSSSNSPLAEKDIFSRSPAVGTPVAMLQRLHGSQANQTPKECPNGRILLVEDSQTIGKMTVAVLQRRGFAVDWVINGAFALEKLCTGETIEHINSSSTQDMHQQLLLTRSCSTDEEGGSPVVYPTYRAVLMDLQMPIMDGFEATKRIRLFEFNNSSVSSVQNRHYIIGLSANSDTETIEAARAIGFDSFMDKPINVDLLLELLGKHSFREPYVLAESAVSPRAFNVNSLDPVPKTTHLHSQLSPHEVPK